MDDKEIRSAIASGEIPRSVHETLERSASKFPNNNLIIFNDFAFTYGQIDALASRFANALIRIGLRDGDRVVCYMSSCPQFAIAYYGTLRAGGVLVPIDHRYREVELRNQISDSEASIVVTLDSLFEKFKNVIEEAGAKKIILTKMGELETFQKQSYANPKIDAEEENQKATTIIRLIELIAKNSSVKDSVKVDPFTHLAAMPYTTGTTGPSKGVMLTHFNLLSSQYQFNHALQNKIAKETALVIFPFSHIGGLNAALGTLVHSSNTIIAFEKFDPTIVFDAVSKYRPTLFYGVPSAYISLLSNEEKLSKADFSCIRIALSSSSPLPPEVKLRFMDKTGVGITDTWGMTESSPVLTCSPPSMAKKANVIGFPVVETEVKVIDIQDESKEMPVNEMGELVARGPQVMLGYWKKKEATLQTLRGGWLHTGDIGFKDADGAFYYMERKKDIINVGGLKVWPAEVEAVLYECPSVAEAIVGAESSERYGENVRAWVVLKPGYDQKEQDKILKDYCSTKLARYKTPNTINFVKEIPKSHVGKPLRRAIRESRL